MSMTFDIQTLHCRGILVFLKENFIAEACYSTWNCFSKDLQKAIGHLKAPLRSSGTECGVLMKSY